jgi:hypothetical protein
METRSIDVKLKKIIKHEILVIELVKDVGFADVRRYQKVEGGSTPLEFFPDAKTAIVYIAKMDEVVQTFGRWYIASLNNF